MYYKELQTLAGKFIKNGHSHKFFTQISRVFSQKNIWKYASEIVNTLCKKMLAKICPVVSSRSIFSVFSIFKKVLLLSVTVLKGIIQLVSTQNFPKNEHFLPPPTHTFVSQTLRKEDLSRCLKLVILFKKNFSKATLNDGFLKSPEKKPYTKTYLGLCQTSMMEIFMKIIGGFYAPS